MMRPPFFTAAALWQSLQQQLPHWLARARPAFLRYGWLLPALFPLALIAGRGAFHSLFYLYIFWALLASPGLPAPRTARRTLALLLLPLLCYLPGVLMAADLARALELWSTAMLYTCVAAITACLLAQSPERLEQWLKAMALGALLALLAAWLRLGKHLALNPDFVPRLDLRSVDLAFCLPLLLVGLGAHWAGPWRWLNQRWLVFGAMLALSLYVIVADERSVMVATGMAWFGLCVMVFRPQWMRRGLRLLAGCVALALCALLLIGLSSEALFAGLDATSSLRLSLWRQALTHPPADLLFGVGMGNVQHASAVVLEHQSVRHLHNIWLDAWFDTGFVGLLGLLAMLTGFFALTARAWPALSVAQRRLAGLLLSAALAVLAQSQFSISYASREFGMYALTSLAVLMHVIGQSRADLNPNTNPGSGAPFSAPASPEPSPSSTA